MPFPITRNASVLAFEKMLNDRPAREALRHALHAMGSLSDLAKRSFAAELRNECVGTAANQAVEEMLATIGEEALKDQQTHDWCDGDLDPKQIEAGISHLDNHWFGADSKQKWFWADYEGEPAENVRLALHSALQLAMGEQPLEPEPNGNGAGGDSVDCPIHLTWVCGAPTFDMSVSTVPADGPTVAVSVIISTPPLRFPLASSRGRIVEPEEFKEEQFLYGEYAKRRRDTPKRQNEEPEPDCPDAGQRFALGPNLLRSEATTFSDPGAATDRPDGPAVPDAYSDGGTDSDGNSTGGPGDDGANSD